MKELRSPRQSRDPAARHPKANQRDGAKTEYAQVLSTTPAGVEALYHMGQAHYQRREHSAAITLIREALALDARLVPAHITLGRILQESGRVDEAIASFRQAIAIEPENGEAHTRLAGALETQGRIDDAIEQYRRALASVPSSPDAMMGLGRLMQRQGRLDEAEECYRRLISAQPNHAAAHEGLGVVLRGQGRLDEAIESYRRAIAIKPDYAEAHSNLGNALKDRGRPNEAVESGRRAVALRPNHPDLLINLGVSLQEEGQFEEAEACYRRALDLKPDYPEAHNNLGGVFQAVGRLAESEQCYRRAIELKPDYAEAHANLGIGLHLQGRLESAMDSFHRGLALNPDFANAHSNLALAHLLLGDFENGWREYEWRPSMRQGRKLPQRLWAGDDLAGRTVLLYPEQGLGDAIQFLRYVPLVAGRGGRVIVEVPPALGRLAEGIEGAARVVVAGSPLPEFDLCCPLLSLPGRLGTRLESIPARVPYLHPDAELVARWRAVLGEAPGLKVGLVWAGNPKHEGDRHRSLSLERLWPALSVPGIRWFSLQVGERAGEVAGLPAGSVVDLSARLTDFAETAAALANLDLVVCVDTAVAHLAGALGRPAWVLLPFVPDWRWLREREDSPWYPTLRLFRQPALGDWESVLGRLRAALEDLTAGAPLAPPRALPAPAEPEPDLGAAREHYRAGRLDQAEAAGRAVLARQPAHAGALQLLGVIELQRGRHASAADLLRRAIAAGPGRPEPHSNLGVALSGLGEFEPAIASFRQAIALKPDYAEAHTNLAVAFRKAGRLEEAAEFYSRSIALKPAQPVALTNLGEIARIQGDFAATLSYCERAIAVDPDNAPAHWNLALVLLRLGRFEEGWREYEWGWAAEKRLPRRHLERPLWDGSALDDRRLLLHAEQGFGDTIQFVRYAVLIRSRFPQAKLVLEVQHPLVDLLQSIDSDIAVVARGEVLPPFDVQAPMLSLPLAMGTTVETIPAPIPYLAAAPSAIKRWAQVMGPRTGLRVGLAWAGSPRNTRDVERSILFEHVLPLLCIAGVEWFSLQKGAQAADLARAPAGRIVDLSSRLSDFAETAAALAHIDLVITVCTAVAHLAGALGKPVWLMNGFVPDWRWLAGRSDSPWYPTMRLFAQSKAGDWETVAREVGAALQQEVATPR